MASIAIEIIIVLLLILLNGVFALSELAVVSARKARLQHMANQGSRGAATALELAAAPNAFLSTVQVGITLVGVFAGAFGGATLSGWLADELASVEPLARYSRAISLALVVAAITYLSLVIGELVPKRVALQNPERVAALVAPPMKVLSRLAYPLVRLLTLSGSAVLWVLGLRPSREPPVTEDEIRLMLEEGTRAGVFRTAEHDMIARVFRLDDRLVRELMTPRHEIQWLDVSDPIEDVRQRMLEGTFSSYPVCRGDIDHVLGVVRAKNLLRDVLAGQSFDLTKHVQKAHFVPETAHVSDVLAQFKRLEQNVVLVIDEHGGIQGLVTEHDIFEAIVGDVASDVALDTPQASPRGEGAWLMDGLLSFDEVTTMLGVPPPTGDMRSVFQTLGGFVMAQVDAVPTVGQDFVWEGFRFEVVDMDGLRVDKVAVERIPATDAAELADALE